MGDRDFVVVVLGGPLIIHCHAIGWPRPSVTWWRGERMLPLSSERFEQFRDYSLLIRRVSFRDLGPYTCQAYNGYGRPSSYTVTLQAVGPVYSTDVEEVEFRRYLIPAPQPDSRAVQAVTRAPATPAPSTAARPRLRPVYVDPFLNGQLTSTTTRSPDVSRPTLGTSVHHLATQKNHIKSVCPLLGIFVAVEKLFQSN